MVYVMSHECIEAAAGLALPCPMRSPCVLHKLQYLPNTEESKWLKAGSFYIAFTSVYVEMKHSILTQCNFYFGTPPLKGNFSWS